jgi:hypothetical protein
LRTQGSAVDVLHDEIRLAVRQLAVVQNPDDAGMIDARQRLFFLLKFLYDPGVLQRLLEQHFDHNGFVVQFPIAGEIDGADTAATEFFLDEIASINRVVN